jgi:AraC family transcriptional regulator
VAVQRAYGADFARKFHLEDAPVIVARALRSTEIGVTEIRGDRAPNDFTQPQLREDAYLVGLQLRDFPNHGYWEGGKQAPLHSLRAGETTFYDLKRDPIALLDKPYHSIFFYLSRKVLTELAEESNARSIGELNYQPGRGVADRTIMLLGESLRAAFSRPREASTMFVDHVTAALALHVAQSYGGLQANNRPQRGGLAPWQERRAKELMSACLDGSLALRRIAEECELSASHFARAFCRSTGLPPHRWLQARRIELAKDLLRNSRLTLTEVALQCGFADQSHFTRVFSRQTGVAPNAWRRTVHQ